MDEFEIDKHIYSEERGGYPYYIVTGPDGTSHGVWDLGVARAIVVATLMASGS